MTPKPSWRLIKAAYQRGEGSLRELAVEFGVPESTIMQHCSKGRWVILREQTERKVEAKIAEVVANEAAAFVKESIRRARKTLADVDATKEQLLPAVDPMALDALSRVEVRMVDMARKAYGLPDAPTKVEHAGTVKIEVINPYSKKSLDVHNQG